MDTQETREYLLKPSKVSSGPKASVTIPVPKKFFDQPAPDIDFEGQSFCFTGVFVFEDGDRSKCEAAIRARGGYCYDVQTAT